MKLTEVLGNIIETQEIGFRKIYKTDKGVYLNFKLTPEMEFGKCSGTDVEQGYTVHDLLYKESSDDKYFRMIDALKVDGKILIVSTHFGDERGAVYFNDTFIVLGHDGFIAYNVKNPFEIKILHS